VPEARNVVDLALAPVLERVRAPAGDGQVEAVRRLDERGADRPQLLDQGHVLRVHAGARLDHAVGDLGLDVARMALAREQREQVRSAARQITVAGAEQLQLELHAQREGRRRPEVEHAHQVLGAASPASRSAK
jgi:hypothetical protein